MTCCGSPLAGDVATAALQGPDALDQWVRDAGDGGRHLDLLVPGIHCAGCIGRIEKALAALPGVTLGRVNLSTRRVAVEWRADETDAEAVVGCITALGYQVQPFDPDMLGAASEDAQKTELLRALAVAGFAAGNIMLLSVSVWSGAEDATRDLFHWISALIALPTVIFAGRPFYRSAVAALRHGRLNMDVPISLAVILAAGMSLHETIVRGEEAYFDASVTLLFFLLVGRYLDHMMRARARSAVAQLMALNATGATVVAADGSQSFMPASRLQPGMTVAVAAGQRVPADGEIVEGATSLDRSLVTGETMPEEVAAGDTVHAGVLNLTGPVLIRVSAAGESTFLAEVIRLMETAETGKTRYVRIADRAAALYAPLVHIVAGLTFLGWLVATGGDWHTALFVAISVLIITCPCALGLAVPVVQVVASGVLFRNGVMVKDGAALERLAAVDTVVFDKTGTLTLGRPELVGPAAVDASCLAVAAGLARMSRHPLSVALFEAAQSRGIRPADVAGVEEHAGAGLTAQWHGDTVRLGSRLWCGLEDSDGDRDDGEDGRLELCLRIGGRPATVFTFEDAMRPDAGPVVEALKAEGHRIEILSGDRPSAVRAVARRLGVAQYKARWTPQDKVAYVQSLAAAGRKVLMVGDGINDAPALAAGHASMAPASASDIGRTAADLVFTGLSLAPVLAARDMARRALRVVHENFALAVLYNLIAVPIAVLGHASPLVAAVAMSSSSLVVTANALRLRFGAGGLAGRDAGSRAGRPAVDEASQRRAA